MEEITPLPEQNKAEKKPRNLHAVFWFAVFIGVLLLVSYKTTKPSLSLSKLFTNSGQGSVEKIFRNEVVKEESTIIDVVEQVSPAVVSIVVKQVGFDVFSGPYSSEDGVGTGFIVTTDGVIVTNSHVVDSEAGEYSVVLNDGTAYEVKRVNLDVTSDLALLELESESELNLPTVELGDSDSLVSGQTAIAIGNALGKFQNTVTVGVVSGIARDFVASSGFGDATTYENAIQTDAALNPGNSGGPLLNSAGQVIGINVATTRGADNIGFAIPVNTLKPILESFLVEGRIIRPYMGIAYTIITKDISAIRRLPEGVFVNTVLAESPADQAGIEEGDIITKLNGVQLSEDNPLSAIISSLKVGDSVAVEVDRAGDILTLDVVLEEAPNDL